MKYLCKYFFSIFIVLLIGCNKDDITIPNQGFSEENLPSAPDYSIEGFWAALPNRIDDADFTPNGYEDNQSTAIADVFYIHPTTYLGNEGEDQWNAPVDDANLNATTNEYSIRLEASLFNSSGKVYAPYYRQAHIATYYVDDVDISVPVFNVAYQDLKNAFEYYLDNYNQGRPIIIAAHSQGTLHGIRLIKEFFDGTQLYDQFVVAYLLGEAVSKNQYNNISICNSPNETGCFVSWRTFESDYIPENDINFPTSDNIAVVNPLTWTITPDYVPNEFNAGGYIEDINLIEPNLTSAQILVDQGILWADKPNSLTGELAEDKNYHFADFNFYYVNIRNNVQDRIDAF